MNSKFNRLISVERSSDKDKSFIDKSYNRNKKREKAWKCVKDKSLPSGDFLNRFYMDGGVL